MNKFANEYFTRNINNPRIQDDPKNWHKSLQTFTKYKSSNQLLNTINGPIANTTQWKMAQEKIIDWEEVHQERDKNKIDTMNAEWIREQFAEEEAIEEALCENCIKIKEERLLKAFKKIGKNKSPSYDGMMDVIF